MVPAPDLCATMITRRKRARSGATRWPGDDPRRVGVIIELIDHTIAILN